MRWIRPVGWESTDGSRFPRGGICLCISCERRTTAESIRGSNDNIFAVICPSARTDARRPGHTLIHSAGSQLCAGYRIAAVLLTGWSKGCIFRNASGRIFSVLMKKNILFGNTWGWNICASLLLSRKWMQALCKEDFWKSATSEQRN